MPAALITTYFKLFEVAIRASGDRGANNEVSAKSRLLQALLFGEFLSLDCEVVKLVYSIQPHC